MDQGIECFFMLPDPKTSVKMPKIPLEERYFGRIDLHILADVEPQWLLYNEIDTTAIDEWMYLFGRLPR